MEIDRRTFIGGAAASLILGNTAGASRNEGPMFAASCKTASGDYSAVVFSLNSGVLTQVPLPDRGHDIAQRPGRPDCVVFARRPGNFAGVFEAGGRRPARFFTTRPDRHFFGHGVFSSDGKLLYATENDFQHGRGVIGIRDATDRYRWIGEFLSDGTGPHDLAVLSDARTLVVANGGIDTHPDSGREMLDLAAMQPSLAYIDLRSGDVLETHKLDAALHQLSIRHLALGARDTVVFACQFEGPATEHPPLVGFHRRGEPLRMIEAPAPIHRRMRNYAGSAAVSRTGDIAAVSSPRGGLITYWDIAARRYIGCTDLADGCGVTGTGHGSEFLLTSGTGEMLLGPDKAPLDAHVTQQLKAYAWDNHAALLEFSDK